jgi:hypothetical protein
MKKYIVAVVVIMTGAISSLPAYAADGIKTMDVAKQEIQLVIAAVEAQRKSVVAQNLYLSDKESGFWAVYNEYRAEMRKAADTQLEIVTDYADAYRNNSLSDKAAVKLIDRFLSVQEKRVKIKKRFVKKFKKVLSAKNVARFYQIDNRVDLLVQMQTSSGIPLVE